MTTPTSDRKQLVLDNSSVEPLELCPRRYFYAHRLNRIPAEPAPALRFGGILHEVLGYRYRMLARTGHFDEDAMNRIARRRFERQPCETEGWRNCGTTLKIIVGYNLKYSEEPFTVLKDINGSPYVEKSFAAKLGEIGQWDVIYIGRIDLIIKQGTNIFVVDTKTTSMLGETFWEAAAMSEQLRGYCFIARELLGQEPTGYMYNVIAARAPT